MFLKLILVTNNKIRKFETIAYDILQESYEIDSNKAELTLMRPIPEFDSYTTIQAAKASENMDLVAHVSVQNILARIWYSQIMTDTSDFKAFTHIFEIIFFFE
jgi:hypothetical protein